MKKLSNSSLYLVRPPNPAGIFTCELAIVFKQKFQSIKRFL
jgi:hypothetical protein